MGKSTLFTREYWALMGHMISTLILGLWDVFGWHLFRGIYMDLMGDMFFGVYVYLKMVFNGI